MSVIFYENERLFYEKPCTWEQYRQLINDTSNSKQYPYFV